MGGRRGSCRDNTPQTQRHSVQYVEGALWRAFACRYVARRADVFFMLRSEFPGFTSLEYSVFLGGSSVPLCLWCQRRLVTDIRARASLRLQQHEVAVHLRCIWTFTTSRRTRRQCYCGCLYVVHKVTKSKQSRKPSLAPVQRR